MFPTAIPDEVILHILSFMPLSDQLQFSQTCTHAEQISHERSFWRPRIQALAPQSALEPTKQQFMQSFRRALNETAFLTRNHAKITAMLAPFPEKMTEFSSQLRMLQAICLNPWGERCIENLVLINHLLEEINENIAQSQIPPAGIYLRLECLTRLPSTTIARNHALFAELQKLELQDNFLENLPTNIDILQNCYSLNVYNNPMRYLPASFASLQNIAFLYLSEGHMPTIPNVIFTLKKLQWLSFSHMGLTELSNNIGQLKNLTWLYLRDNHLSVLPEAFYKLTKLRELFLDHNPLSALQFQRVLELLKRIQCDIHDRFKAQFALLKTENKAETGDVEDLIERFNLLSTTPVLTPQHSSLRRRTLLSSDNDLGAHLRMNMSL